MARVLFLLTKAVSFFRERLTAKKQKDMDMIIFRKLNLKKILKKRRDISGNDLVSARGVKGARYGGMDLYLPTLICSKRECGLRSTDVPCAGR